MSAIVSVHTHFETSQTQSNSVHFTVGGSEDVSYQAADHWSRVSTSYLQSGDLMAALEARQKAVEVYRLLHAKQPELFESDLARELLGLSKDLAGNGLIEAALEASQESVMHYRHFIGKNTQCSAIYEDSNDKRETGIATAIDHDQIFWIILDSSTSMLKFAQSLSQIPRSIIKGIIRSRVKAGTK